LIASRAHLIERLHQAAEAEHSLCCQYLYAAFSLRRMAADFPAESRGDAAELVMTATQGWANVKDNVTKTYAKLSNVTLDITGLRIEMLGK